MLVLAPSHFLKIVDAFRGESGGSQNLHFLFVSCVNALSKLERGIGNKQSGREGFIPEAALTRTGGTVEREKYKYEERRASM